jgi:hypothetical protein
MRDQKAKTILLAKEISHGFTSSAPSRGNFL